ncbi:MAG: hypothetical protein M1434_08100 [Chloroflexi bacterium]|nr:hypothetical protein [Chloroflexota bacterium]MCL5274692.1 hypothetical protein [Chloroflexota bacterium]
MFQITLLISTLFSIASAAVYGYVAARLSRRTISNPGARFAWQSFSLWWYCLAATTLVSGILNLLGAFNWVALPFFVALTYVNILLVCIALWGLLYYLVYLFTGSQRFLIPLTIFYILYYVLLVYLITASDPDHLEISRWATRLVYAHPLTGPFFALALVLLVFPQILASLAYFTLFFRVREATQRYRVLLVSWCIILWFGSAFVASAAGLSGQDWWQIVSRLIGLGATVGILLAYLPPATIRRRFGIASIAEQAQA